MKRGQVTIIVIIGLVLLLIVGLVLLINRPQANVATPETEQVTALVQSCIRTVGEDVVRQVGMQGGYWNMDTLAPAGKDAQLATLPMRAIPLWHEVHSCGNPLGCIGDNHPALCIDDCPIREPKTDVSFQSSIAQGIDEKLAACLDFSSLPVTVALDGTPTTTVTIRRNDVLIVVEYPMTVTGASGGTLPLEEFSATLPVDLVTPYTLARKIQATETRFSFLENAFMHLISIYAVGIDGPIPPLRDLQFMGAPKYWVTNNVKTVMEQDMMPYLSFLQFPNAEEGYVPLISPDTNETYAPYADGIYEYLTIAIDNQSYPLGVRSEYAGPLQLDINGKQLLKPRRMPDTGILKFLGLDIRDYRFRYTASFPVVFHVTDDAAFQGRGYTLSFGLEGNVRNNHPLNVSSAPTNIGEDGVFIDLASPTQLVDHTYTLTLTDQHTSKPLGGALITYSCGGEYSLGAADGAGVWRGKLPYCFAGGYLIATKDGYAQSGIPQDNPDDDGQTTRLAMSLWPYRQKAVRVEKVNGSGARLPLGANDTAVVQIARIKASPMDDDVPIIPALQYGASTQGVAKNSMATMRVQLDNLLAQGAITRQEYDDTIALLDDAQDIPEQTPVPAAPVQFVDLIPGTYELDGTLLYAGFIAIPEEKRCEKILGGLSEKCVTLPPQNFTSWASGGVILQGPDGMQLSEEDLYSDANITILLLEQPIPATWKMMEKYQSIKDYQTYERKAWARPVIG